MRIFPTPLSAFRRAASALAAFSLCGCFSTTDIPESPDDVTVEIELSHSTRRESGGGRPLVAQQITAVLRDRKRKAIENDSLRMSVNGVPMPLSVSRGNYGEHYPRYRPPDGLLVHADSAYRFSLVWRDGTRRDAGTIRTPPPLTLAHFDVPATHRGGPLAIRWRGLAGRAVLTASPSYETVDSVGNRGYEAGGAAADGSSRREIGPGTGGGASGSWVLPASLFLETPRRRTYAVVVEVTATSERRAPRPFARGSYLRAQQTLEMWIDVPAPDSAGGAR